MGHMATQLFTKKTIELDNDAIRKVRVILDVKTDKEAVNRALRIIADEDDIIRTHQALAGSTDLLDLFS